MSVPPTSSTMLETLWGAIRSWNWGTLGEWAGALGTSTAVILALRKPKPDLIVDVQLKHQDYSDTGDVVEVDKAGPPVGSFDIFLITVTNAGNGPAILYAGGVHLPRREGRHPETRIPIEPAHTLLPAAKYELRVRVDGQSILTGEIRLDAVFILDSSGHQHYPRVSLAERVGRRLWWLVGTVKR